MKIRNGFVSNSSSSNFIIKLDTIPTSEKHLEEILGVENYDNLEYWGDYIDKKTVVNKIYNDIKQELNKVGNKTIEDIKLSDEIYIYDESDVNEYKEYISDDKCKEYHILCNKLLKLKDEYHNTYDKFIIRLRWSMSNILTERIVDLIKEGMIKNLSTNSKFIKLTYGDDNGELEGYIEHSDILEPITFKRFSHH